jgi:hypothetical protein
MVTMPPWYEASRCHRRALRRPESDMTVNVITTAAAAAV